MITITIKQDLKLPKKDFEDGAELLEALEVVLPLQVYQVSETDVSEQSAEKIRRSRENPERQLTDFQG